MRLIHLFFVIVGIIALAFIAAADTPPPTQVLQLKAGSCVGAVQGASGNLSCGSIPSSLLPNGTANTVSYYNNSGASSNDTNLRWFDPNGYLIASTFSNGATAGNAGVGTSQTGPAFVMGSVNGASSILSTNYGVGNIAFGYSVGSSQISAQFNGSMAGGYATGAGIIATENSGGFAMGRADTSGQVSSNGLANLAFGYADNNSILGSQGAGSTVLGYATSNSNLQTTTGKFGQFAGGYAATSANMTAGGNGSFLFGYADSASGAISATGDGSTALGRSHNGLITSSGTGSLAYGYTSGFNLTASGNGSFAGGNPLTAALAATNTNAFAFGDANTSSGVLATTFGLGNTNPVYATIVGGKYASVSGTAGSWVTTDPLFVLGNGVSGTPANAFSVLKNGSVTANTFTGSTFTGSHVAPNGGVSAPSYSFANAPSSGLYLVGSTELGLAVNGAEALDFQTSTSNYGNVGMGGPSSLSDQYPLIIQRTNSSAGTFLQVSNPTASANANATIQLATDSSNQGNISVYTTGSTVPPYIASMVVRATGGTQHLTLIGGDNTGNDVRVWTNGDYTSAGETASFNGDHSTTLFGLLQLPVQGSGVTPTCGAGQNGALALTNGHKLCVCTGSAWKNASDGSTACTF